MISIQLEFDFQSCKYFMSREHKINYEECLDKKIERIDFYDKCLSQKSIAFILRV